MASVERWVFSEAVRLFWETRDLQQFRSGPDQGARRAVTGGKQMDGFAATLTDLMMQVGVSESEIYTGKYQTDLPGFFRATKGWDILVVRDNHLLAAIELKSIVSSVGNNLNNCNEEAVGSAVDIWTAFRERAFVPSSTAPWLGYLLLLVDSAQSQRPVGVNEPHFSVMGEFQEASYAKRAELLCRRLVLERKYTSACFITANPDNSERQRNYKEPAKDLTAPAFVSSLLRHVRRL